VKQHHFETCFNQFTGQHRPQSLVRQRGTVCRRKWRRHHWHSDSSLAGWKLKCFYVATMCQRSHHNFYYNTAWNTNHHHHHERALGWSVAVSTSCLHRSVSWASRHAELSPWLSGWSSAFRVRSQVWRGHPGRRLQSLGSPRVDVCRALEVSW